MECRPIGSADRARKAGRIVPIALFCAILGLALALRLHGLGAKPLWLDEVFTQKRSALSVHGLILDSLRNRHSPLFFLIEHVMLGFGSGAATLRLVAAFTGAFCAALVFAIGREAGLKTGAVLAGLMAALAPLQVGFGQEARSYTLMLVLILVALWGLVRMAATPERVRRPWLDRAGLPGAWAAYGLGTAGALWVLGDAVPWLIAANVAMLAVILPRIEGRGGFLVRWIAVQAAIVVIAGPVYLAMVRAVHAEVIGGFLWISPLTPGFLWTDAASLYGLSDATMVSMRLLPGPVPYLAPVAIALGGLGFFVLRRAPGPRAVLLIAAAGLPVVLALVSLVHPVLLPRYLLWSAAPFFVISGAAVEALPRAVRPAALGVAAVVLTVNLFPYYRAETKPRWDLAASFLTNRSKPGDAVLVADGAAPVMLRAYSGSTQHFVTTRQVARAAEALANGGRVFAIYGPAGQGKLPSESAFFANAAALGVAGARQAIGQEITIEEIDPRGRGGLVACGGAGGGEPADPRQCPPGVRS
ncbi:MAG: glycosyltransferase family 39 protein [Rhodospirillales bacterium]|nr:glycosyltransferase family 39 protein [Rhodospirillales bacterium]